MFVGAVRLRTVLIQMNFLDEWYDFFVFECYRYMQIVKCQLQVEMWTSWYSKDWIYERMQYWNPIRVILEILVKEMNNAEYKSINEILMWIRILKLDVRLWD